MNLKTFRAATMAETLAKVKEEFGSEAVILSTRTISRGKVLGMGGGEAVEITAARDASSLPPEIRPKSRRAIGRDAGRETTATEKSVSALRQPSEGGRSAPRSTVQVPQGVEAYRQSVAAGASRPTSIVRTDAPAQRGGVDPRPHVEPRVAPAERTPGRDSRAGVLSESLVEEMGELRSLVSRLVRQQQVAPVRDLPEGLFETYQKLVGHAVAEELARKLVLRVRDAVPTGRASSAVVRRELGKAMKSMLPPASPIRLVDEKRPTVVALVGPTGVGKTTTVAKLAANMCLRQGRRVGLVTMDTYRIAAAEQLRTYAEIIDLPLAVVSSPDQLAEAVGHMADRDLVLIDTAGRSQRDHQRIAELCEFFSAVRPDEVHLVLSSTSDRATLDEIIKRFKVVRIDRVIFTKLDEAVGFGVVLECLQKADAALSYLTMGQDVPHDIATGEADRLAEWLLSGRPDRGTPRAPREGGVV